MQYTLNTVHYTKMKLTLLVILLFFFAIELNAEQEIIHNTIEGEFVSTVKESSENDVRIVSVETRTNDKKKKLVSSVAYHSTGKTTGWDKVDAWIDKVSNNDLTAYLNSFGEATVTVNITAAYWENTMKNFCHGQAEVCKKIRCFVRQNNKWVNNMITKHNKTDEYWWQVGLVYKGIQGFIDGYNQAKGRHNPKIPDEDFLFMNLRGDIYDLITKFSKKCSQKNTFDGLGSAIVKLLPGNKDVVVGQNSWFGYNTMTRIGKRYEYPFRTGHNKKTLVPGKVLLFSGYPGVIHSIDNFYITSSHLTVQKTALKNYNDKLWNDVKPENMVFGFVRTLVANRLATDGKSWSKIVSKYNSGTANSQWSVVDFKKFKHGETPKRGLLWVVEQIPGSVVGQDMTSKLLRDSYWASYNIPLNKPIYEETSYPKMAKKYGDWFTFDNSPRALISKRDNKHIKCIYTLLSYLRSNNYKNDRFSKCKCKPHYSATNAIAARLDLNLDKGTYPFGYLGRHPGGAIDAKATNSSLVCHGGFLGISGPTAGSDLPVFQWSRSGYKGISHKGQPDRWHYGVTLIGHIARHIETPDSATDDPEIIN